VKSSEFDGSDPGVGGLFAWYPMAFLGTEAETTFYPANLRVKNGTPYSRSRLEGLFGVTVGPVVGRLRPFGAVKTGFVTVQRSPGLLACVAIFPTTLPCVLASGETVAATVIGGGLEVFATGRAKLRFEFGDRVMRYPGPAIDAEGRSHSATFSEHELRITVGAGIRF
jgi:hypothetical protein